MERKRVLKIGIICAVISLVSFSIFRIRANQTQYLVNPIASTANKDWNTFYFPFILTSACQNYTAFLDITLNKDTLVVGDTLRITLTLQNAGCSNLGLPYYQIQPPAIDHLEEVTPRLQAHYLSIEPSNSDTTIFSYKASSAGQVTIYGQADFEVHLGTSPPLNGHAETENLTITINPP